MRPFLVICAIAAAASLAAQEHRTVIAVGTLLDGRGHATRDTRVVVQGTKIVAIDPKAAPIDYDLHGATMTPGWIDTHIHLNWHFDANHKSVSAEREAGRRGALLPPRTRGSRCGRLHDRAERRRDRSTRRVRDRITQGLLPGPRILTSLRQITDRSGDPDALRALVRQTKADGADVIKLFATSGLGAGGNQTMSDAQIQATCGEASAVGLRSVVHAIGDAGARAAVAAGCTSIEHGTFLTDATLDLMAARGTYFDPNLLVLHNYLDNRDGFSFHAETLATLEKGIAPTIDVLRRARARNSQDRLRHRRGRRRARPQRRGVRLSRARRARDADGRASSARRRLPPHRSASGAASAPSRPASTPTSSRSTAIRSRTSPPSGASSS